MDWQGLSCQSVFLKHLQMKYVLKNGMPFD